MSTVPILYFAPGTCARVSLTALEEIGRPFETRLVAFLAGEHRSDAYLKLNPSGKVPALDTGSAVLSQNGAILLYLARTSPEAGLLPLSGDLLADALVVSALFRFSADLHPLVNRFVLPGMTTGRDEGAADVRSRAEELLVLQLQPIATQLEGQPYFLGSQWSVLDAYLAWVWFRITGAGFDEGRFPSIQAHYALAGLRPSAQAALAREELAEAELEARGLSFSPPPART